MRALLTIGLMAILAAKAVGTCVCVLGPAIIYPNGDALCFAKRYETGDCEKNKPGQCQRPTNVKEFRKKDEYRPEYCPHCRPYGPRISNAASAAPADEEPEHEHADDSEETTDAGPPDPLPGLPVNEDFDPQKAKMLPEGAQAQLVGFFTLRMGKKLATDLDSEHAVSVGKDVYVKLFAVNYPFTAEEQLVAFETKSKTDSSKIVRSRNIRQVSFEPRIGEWALTIKASHEDFPESAGKSIFVLLGRKSTSEK